MSEYLDVWAEFRAVLAKTEKKLLKTPDYATAVKQLGRISLKMQDLETPQDAATCHIKMAQFNRILKRPIEERRDLLMAANLLRQCWDKHKESLSRTAELLPREFFGRTDAWYLMLEMFFEQEDFQNFITTLDDLWIFVMKTKPKTFVGRKWLKECELLTILCLKTEEFMIRRPTGRHRILLDMYGVLSPLYKDPRGQKVKLEEETALSRMRVLPKFSPSGP